jgi:hypothetical protein
MPVDSDRNSDQEEGKRVNKDNHWVAESDLHFILAHSAYSKMPFSKRNRIILSSTSQLGHHSKFVRVADLISGRRALEFPSQSRPSAAIVPESARPSPVAQFLARNGDVNDAVSGTLKRVAKDNWP